MPYGGDRAEIPGIGSEMMKNHWKIKKMSFFKHIVIQLPGVLGGVPGLFLLVFGQFGNHMGAFYKIFPHCDAARSEFGRTNHKNAIWGGWGLGSLIWGSKFTKIMKKVKISVFQLYCNPISRGVRECSRAVSIGFRVVWEAYESDLQNISALWCYESEFGRTNHQNAVWGGA